MQPHLNRQSENSNECRFLLSGSLCWLLLSAPNVLLATEAEPPAATKPPSAAYEKCQQFLDSTAAKHLVKANKLRDAHAAKMTAQLQKLDAESLAAGKDPAILRGAMERAVERNRPDDAYAAYVTDLIKLLTTIKDPDGPNFNCGYRQYVFSAYKLNIDAYDDIFDKIDQDIKERLQLEQLDQDEGLVIIAFNSNAKADFVRINRRGSLGGAISFGPIFPGEYFRVVKAKQGTYNWDEISEKMRIGNGRLFYDFSQFDQNFEVVAGKLNYAGVFLFDVRGNYYSGRLNDRLTITLTVLEQRYPELIGQYDIANGLHRNDRFIDYWLQQRALAKESPL